jgi:hypothetical protein
MTLSGSTCVSYPCRLWSLPVGESSPPIMHWISVSASFRSTGDSPSSNVLLVLSTNILTGCHSTGQTRLHFISSLHVHGVGVGGAAEVDYGEAVCGNAAERDRVT